MDFNQLNLLIGLGREYGHACIRDLAVSDTGHRICTFLHFHGAVSQDTAASALMRQDDARQGGFGAGG